MEVIKAKEFAKNFNSKKDFKKAWINKVSDSFDLKDSSDLYGLVEDRFINKEVSLVNTVRGKSYQVDAIDFLYKSFSSPYNMVENGMLFVNHYDELPPGVQGQMELYDTRREIKDEAIYYLTEGDDPKLGQLKNLQQQLLKLVMN